MERLYQSSKIKLPYIIIINFPQLLLFYDYVYYILSFCDGFTLFFESAKLRALCGNINVLIGWVEFLLGLCGLHGSNYILHGSTFYWVIIFTWFVAWVNFFACVKIFSFVNFFAWVKTFCVRKTCAVQALFRI